MHARMQHGAAATARLLTQPAMRASVGLPHCGGAPDRCCAACRPPRAPPAASASSSPAPAERSRSQVGGHSGVGGPCGRCQGVATSALWLASQACAAPGSAALLHAAPLLPSLCRRRDSQLLIPNVESALPKTSGRPLTAIYRQTGSHQPGTAIFKFLPLVTSQSRFCEPGTRLANPLPPIIDACHFLLVLPWYSSKESHSFSHTPMRKCMPLSEMSLASCCSRLRILYLQCVAAVASVAYCFWKVMKSHLAGEHMGRVRCRVHCNSAYPREPRWAWASGGTSRRREARGEGIPRARARARWGVPAGSQPRSPVDLGPPLLLLVALELLGLQEGGGTFGPLEC